VFNKRAFLSFREKLRWMPRIFWMVRQLRPLSE